jgi:hypothetical protein
VLLVVIASFPSAALAQTLTVEVEVEAPTAAPLPPTPASAPPAVIVVRPLEDELPRARVVEDDPIVPSEPVTEPAPSSEPEVEGFIGWSGWLDQMDLSRLAPTFGGPEIAALSGVQLTPDWAGSAPLASQTIGGVGLVVGMRQFEFLRGPELRFSFGGGAVGGPWAPAPGVDGLELSVRDAYVFRVEGACGLQLPVGPVSLYALGTASVGGAWMGVAVRDGRLGALGGETIAALVWQLGAEAGVEAELGDGVVLGAAFRGAFLGVESLGGVVTLGGVFSDDP